MEIPNLTIGVVTGPDDVVKFWDWLTDRPKGYVAVDIETGNTDPDRDARHWYEPGAHVRMVQFGDAQGGWAIPMQGWENLVRGAFDWLNQARIKQVWHNGFTFDSTYLEYCHGIKLDPTLLEDTFVYAGLIGYAEDSRELKRIGEFQLGGWAALGQEQLKTGMKNAGWNWSTVPMNWMPYPVYGVVDTSITAMLWEKWEAERKKVAYFHAREIAAAAMTNRACMTGIMVDGAYLERTYRKWANDAKDLEERCKAQGWGEPSKTEQIRRILTEANVLNDQYLTDGGLISVDKKQLTEAAAKHPLAQLVLDWRWTDRVANNYLRKLWAKVDYATSPQVVHPSIWTMEARTSRMCLPTSHRLLTQRGALPIEQVEVGDRTIDADGHWVSIRQVHRYEDQATVRWTGPSADLESTPEHRWVNYTEHTGSARRISPIVGQKRRILVLAPEVEPFDFGRRTFGAKTDSGVLAAVVGLLVSDGRMHHREETGQGAKAMIYQTEGKFYREIMDLIPCEAISYDRVTTETKSGPHHEIGLRMRWLRPLLENAGLMPARGTLLKDSPGLVPWVLSLSDEDSRLFFQAVWMADGCVSSGNRNISCGNANLQEALRIVAYRCGLSSRILYDAPGSWSTRPRAKVTFRRSRVATREMQESVGRSDVWCVTTDTGTFTAWGPQGPYLTGNSVSDPPVQQFPATDPTVRKAIIAGGRDEVLIAADYGQIEVRGWAALYEDKVMLELINESDRTGEDYFVLVARQLFGDPTFQKSNPLRKPVKNTSYALQYGASVAKIAEMIGLPQDDVEPIVRALRSTFPSYADGGASKIDDLGNGVAQTVLPDGRSFQVRTWSEHRKLPNYRVQGWAAGVLKEAMLAMNGAGLGEYLRMLVHDEVILSAPRDIAQDVAKELQECMNSVVDPAVYGVSVTAEPTIGTRWAGLKD